MEGNEVQTTVAAYLLFNVRKGLVTKEAESGRESWIRSVDPRHFLCSSEYGLFVIKSRVLLISFIFRTNQNC